MRATCHVISTFRVRRMGNGKRQLTLHLWMQGTAMCSRMQGWLVLLGLVHSQRSTSMISPELHVPLRYLSGIGLIRRRSYYRQRYSIRRSEILFVSPIL